MKRHATELVTREFCFSSILTFLEGKNPIYDEPTSILNSSTNQRDSMAHYEAKDKERAKILPFKL